MTKTSILCYQKNGGGCRNRVSLANNFICGAGHGGPRQTSSVSSGLQVVTPVTNFSKMSPSQRYDLARDISTLPEILDELAGDEDESVRWVVAGNSSASPETLAQMAEDEDRYVRYAVAGNSSTSPALLDKLAKDKDDDVRRAVAENRLTWLGTYISLAQEGYSPHGFTEGKPIDELIKDISLVDQYPGTFGRAYLYRLTCDSLLEDETHPKKRALIGYIYAKLAESDRADFHDKQIYKDRIQALFPDDQEMAEIIGY